MKKQKQTKSEKDRRQPNKGPRCVHFIFVSLATTENKMQRGLYSCLPMPTGLQLTASKHIEREREEAVSGHEDQLA